MINIFSIFIQQLGLSGGKVTAFNGLRLSALLIDLNKKPLKIAKK
jgi:hypothetical protein